MFYLKAYIVGFITRKLQLMQKIVGKFFETFINLCMRAWQLFLL